MKSRLTRNLAIVVIAATAAVALGAGIRHFDGPDLETHQTSLFRAFEELDRLGAYVVGEDGEMLGKIRKGFDSDSLGNEYGAGSRYKTNGLFNEYSKHGSPHSSTSAFNKHASSPPQIIIKKDEDILSIGLLTTNPHATTRGQKINPYLLKAWLNSN